MSKNQFYILGFLCAVVLAWAPLYARAESASLSIVPETGVYPLGEPFTIELRVDTDGAPIGTADATIAYDPEDMAYVSFSDEGSVFSTILVDSKRVPGEIDISGFIERGKEPYRGADGLFIRITFMPLRNVATQVRFSKGGATAPFSLGASVGSLTNILSQLDAASYSFVPRERLPANVPTAFAQEEFEITPLPLPENSWFSTTTVTLSWTVPENATAMRTGVSETADGIPEDTRDTLSSSITLSDLVEGTQYFLLQFMQGGAWGTVIRYPLEVDVSDPSYITLQESKRSDPSDPRVAFVVDSSDAFSGISHFIMSIDGEEKDTWTPNEEGIYIPEGLTPGEHVLTATAVDKAGNSTTTEAVFLVRSIESPTLNNESIPDRVLVGDTITLRGTTYPNAEVTTYISLNEGEATEKMVTSNADGAFVVTITEGARAGKYTVWFTVTDERGAVSPNSIRRSIDVSQPYIMLFGSIAVTYLSVIVPLVGLIVLLSLILWLVYTWIRGYRGRVRRETKEAFHSAQDEFDSLRQELTKQIGMLEKANQSRELTREEMRIFTDLSKRLDKIERHITQEIEDIEDVEEKEVHAQRTRTVEGSLEEYRGKLQRTAPSDSPSDSHVLRLK